MSLTSNFDKLNKSKANKEPSQSQETDEIESYATAGTARNLCFVQPDGERMFLNYAYLISGSFSPKDNTITLTYTTHQVILKGYNIATLLEELMAQKPRKIICIDERYADTKEDNEMVIMEITIKEKG